MPNELLLRARRSDEDAALFDRFARRNIAMISRAIDRQGFFVGGVAAFLLAAIATLALRNGSEPALGVLLMLGPMMLISAHSGWRIQQLARAEPTPERLAQAFFQERRISMAAAAFSIIFAFGVARARHGAGWFEVMISGL